MREIIGTVAAREGGGKFSGRLLFDLKDQHGLPWDFAIDTIVSRGIKIDWAGMVARARECRWWDFQLFDAVAYAIDDAGLPRAVAADLKQQLREAIMAAQPHPMESAA